ncbi:MAG: O-antigen ligase family protein [Phycisphaerae bacterium]|nr:O-antigen ligase family protein [Phycisphaerae bacterium]
MMNNMLDNTFLSYDDPVYENKIKHDGFWAALLLGMLFFGPRSTPTMSLPPFRVVDFIIVYLFFSRLYLGRYQNGFIFSSANKVFSILMLLLTFVLVISTFINVAIGKIPFFLKDFNLAVSFVRAVVIASVASSFVWKDKQVRQFAFWIMSWVFLAGLLAFVQKFFPYMASGIIEKLYAVEYTRLEIETSSIYSRVAGTFGNPNMFGYGLVFLGTTSLTSAIYLKGRYRFWHIVLYLFIGFAVLITTGSRTSLGAFVIVTFMVLIMSLKGNSKIGILFVMFMVIVLYFLVKVNIHSLPLNERVKDVLAGQEGAVEEGIYSRYALWEKSFEAAKESIVFGEGASRITFQLSDNGYIMMLLRTGIIGAILYLSLLIYLIIIGVSSCLNETRQLQKAIVYMGVAALVNHLIFELTADFLWNVELVAIWAAYMGILCGISYQRKQYHFYSYCNGNDLNTLNIE